MDRWPSLLTLCVAVVIATCRICFVQAAPSAEPPPKFLSRHPESMYDYQKLPRGVYLPEDDNPGKEKFTFSGCEPKAYLTFDIDYLNSGIAGWNRRRLTTEVLCQCKEMLYQDSPQNEPIRPTSFSMIPLSLCIVAAQAKGKICDCETPKRLLPALGQFSANQHVEDVQHMKRLIVSDSGQAIDAPKAPPESSSANAAAAGFVLVVATIVAVLNNR